LGQKIFQSFLSASHTGKWRWKLFWITFIIYCEFYSAYFLKKKKEDWDLVIKMQDGTIQNNMNSKGQQEVSEKIVQKIVGLIQPSLQQSTEDIAQKVIEKLTPIMSTIIKNTICETVAISLPLSRTDTSR
jgi:hypothetical protein